MVIWVSFHLFLVLFNLFFVQFEAGQEGLCKESRCSNDDPPIRFPFRLKDQPYNCGYPHPDFELSCNDKNQTVLGLPNSVKLIVKTINYVSQTINVAYPEDCVARQLPKLNLAASHFAFNFDYYDYNNVHKFSLYNCTPRHGISSELSGSMLQLPCLDVSDNYQVYAVRSSYWVYRFPLTSCIKINNITSVPCQIFQEKEIALRWWQPDCRKCEAKGKNCSLKTYAQESKIVCSPGEHKTSKGSILGCLLLMLAATVIHRVYDSNKIEKENRMKIKRFLEDYRTMRPTRYSYADIKRITNQFRDKLGQGGYGSVYKGMLSEDVFVAVKLLNNSTDDGKDFINEVCTIGRIHHVNVVRLVGFCADGSTRAPVYEFLQNDSLEKFIFFENSKCHPLGWKTLQHIAIGIAKGIEYLHQGCEKRILHFDIKPHNILLDQDFNPKISDFGLAKLCSKKKSVVSMTVARGTIGYIAPEVLSKNFGNVSCKSDVYSYGILLLEMVRGRNNFDLQTENTNRMCFPEWIYQKLVKGEKLQIRIEEDGDVEIVKKLTIIGLWCAQWNPLDRPSMKMVIQMLEGDAEVLTVPPNPFSTTTSKLGRQGERELDIITDLE
ncbi:Glycerophosphodiester phosphodiesterase [Bertholletia excelsa]